MEKRVKETTVLMVLAVGLMSIQCGCGSSGPAKTGFLTDYSRLREESDSTLRYINQRALAKYSNFMVDRVEVHFHKGSKAIEERTKGKLTQQEINDLTNYMHARIVKAIQDSGNRVAYQPAAGVARLRAALTDISGSTAASLLPQAKLFGAGIGGASMETEIIDSMTGEQIGAVVQSKKGSRIPFANLGEWDATKQVIDDWAKKIQERLEEAR
ncbi:MAG: DUF3313 domain-containing protein [Planctomycetota bacterium]|jgi:hypothetical protein